LFIFIYILVYHFINIKYKIAMTEYQNKINIIMIGHTGAGKSQLGNSILQNEVFEVGHRSESKTKEKKMDLEH